VQAASKNVAISQGIQVPCEPLELSSPDHLGGLSSMLLKGAVRRRQVSKKQRLAVESYGKSPEARIALWLKVHPDIPCLTYQPVEPATEGAGGVRLTHVFSGCILSSPSGPLAWAAVKAIPTSRASHPGASRAQDVRHVCRRVRCVPQGRDRCVAQ
jgi:hypothetical protein